MKRRRWTSEQKALVVLEGLRGRPVGELCTEHGISVSRLRSKDHKAMWRLGRGDGPLAAHDREMGVKQAFTSDNDPKGNAETKRFLRTLKEELVWINE